MRNIAREQIKDLFTNPKDRMANGLWFSGYTNEGEYKEWWITGQLYQHCFYKNGQRDGEYEEWHGNGQLYKHCFYKNGAYDGEFKQWSSDGKLHVHQLYKDDKIVKDYLK